MGVSRSATVVCAYLIATNAMTASEAIAFVMKRRSIVSPNTGFRIQLETYSARYCSKDEKTGNIAKVTRRILRSATRTSKAPVVSPPPHSEEGRDTVPQS